MLALSHNFTHMASSQGHAHSEVPYQSRMPRQFAIPAQGELNSEPGGRLDHFSYAEHVRRRKTPHGPVLDDYDVTPTDKTVHMPAAKHVLVSRSDPRSDSNLNRPSNSASLLGAAYHQPTKPGHPPAWEFPGGLDSVLNQSVPVHPSQRYYLQYGSSVPTVLPATMHAYLGPTASAGPEVYGPYWPDGSFNPYRPAPVRDDRFYERLARRIDHSVPVSRSFQGFQQSYSHHFHNDLGHSRTLETTTRKHSSITPISPHVPYHDENASVANIFPPFQTERTEHFQQSGRLPLEKTVESSQYAFRERMFAWAQHIYLSLLASVHKARKQSPSHYRLAGAHHSGAKPLIFPKPPKRPLTNYSSIANRPTYQGPRFHSHSHHHASGLHSADNELSRPPTAIFTPSSRDSGESRGSWPGGHSSSELRSFSDHYKEKYEPDRRISDSAIRDYHAQASNNLHRTASTALEVIEALCNEAGGAWVDGMLLAGCLAYGLEEYGRALQWYQGILQRDETHVEAMSNLAATLLALDRRDEALAYWAAAVKRRPSYFEAVEHLIGLLCADHRAKEAITIIESVEKSLRIPLIEDAVTDGPDVVSDAESETLSRSSSLNTVESLEKAHFDHDLEDFRPSLADCLDRSPPGFGSGGFAIPGADNGRILALIHAKGNMLYSLGDNQGAAAAFEDAILVATGQRRHGIAGLIRRILSVCSQDSPAIERMKKVSNEPILLSPERALLTAKRMFYPSGQLPGLEFVAKGMAQKAGISTTSNSLLSLAKIYQDCLSSATASNAPKITAGTRDILALYYLSLSLQPSPSTANNVGILLASVQQSVAQRHLADATPREILNIAGVVPGSGVALALAYYNFGLNLDRNHAHLYTNLGSLLKDIGQLEPAIGMYERAVGCDPKFDIALANLANAVKDQGRIADAISYYRRAVHANPSFAEAVCGLATALNSVCGWHGRGGIYADKGRRDRVHVSDRGMMYVGNVASGWVSRVVEIVEKQLKDGETWGVGTLTDARVESMSEQLATFGGEVCRPLARTLKQALRGWAGLRWEGSRLVRLIERANQYIGWKWYQERWIQGKNYPPSRYHRNLLPDNLTPPNAPTVLPFHTFTAPLSAKQIRQISQRNGLRISVSTLRSSWLPSHVYPPPPPPRPHLNVGYVSSDFNNHPLAHLMQSIFGLHNPERVRAICYATTKSDGSAHRRQIESEAPVFHDASTWSVERLVNQIVRDGVHILVNLNGYTRGARNEVFAARPAPIHMSFMGFAGTLGAEWCDYIFADEISVPPETLSPWSRTCNFRDRLVPDRQAEDREDWVYAENIIYAKDTFFCVDHKQSAPDAKSGPPPLFEPHLRDQAWERELSRRWKLRKALFPDLKDDTVILGNFNQLYKIDPSIFCTWLRILAEVPNAILWLLRFPDLGEQNLLYFAREWASPEVASRIVFTDVAPKGTHITRASIVDLFLDTPECNAHTTAADVAWSGTPILTWGKWKYKMCSRMASSIVSSAFPGSRAGDQARRDLIVQSEEEYQQHAVELANGMKYYRPTQLRSPLTMSPGSMAPSVPRGRGRLLELRRMLWEGRWTSRLFDTKRWVRDVEKAYWEAWKHWEQGGSRDIWL